jgi:hypothetical protein
LKNTVFKWKTINILFHGNADNQDQTIDVFNVKMSLNRNLMNKDPNVIYLKQLIQNLIDYTYDSIYIYTCSVGVIDGLKELCLIIDENSSLKNGIFLSTDVTGNGKNQNWFVEWGTRYGYLTDDKDCNEMNHASINLFNNIDVLTFSLISGYRAANYRVSTEQAKRDAEARAQALAEAKAEAKAKAKKK